MTPAPMPTRFTASGTNLMPCLILIWRGLKSAPRSVSWRETRKFFLRKEVSHAKDKYISDLLVNGETVTGKDDIINACRDFYAELFTAEPVDDAVIDSFVSNLPIIPAEDRLQCEGPLTVEECLDAIKGMENGKSPGVDGLPKEFYHKFFPLFGADFVTVMTSCFEDGILCPSQRHGLITLICKDKDRKNLLTCWRPISLLTVDLKMISKVMCNRLSKFWVGSLGWNKLVLSPRGPSRTNYILFGPFFHMFQIGIFLAAF